MNESRTVGGTTLYLSPERLSGELASCASDVYALGIVLLLATSSEGCDTLIKAWSSVPHEEAKRAIAAHVGARPAEDRTLLQAMLQAVPGVRPSATDTLQHPYLAFSSVTSLLDEQLQRQKEEQEAAEVPQQNRRGGVGFNRVA